MRSPCCLCVRVSHPINFGMAELFMKLGMYIMASEPISTSFLINPSQTVAMYVSAIVARQRFGKIVIAATNTQATIEECWTCRCPCGLYRIKESRRIVLPRTSCLTTYLIPTGLSSPPPPQPSTCKEVAGAVSRYPEHKPDQYNTCITNTLCRLATRSQATLPHRSVQSPAVNKSRQHLALASTQRTKRARFSETSANIYQITRHHTSSLELNEVIITEPHQDY
jgi:hypothetical protein